MKLLKVTIYHEINDSWQQDNCWQSHLPSELLLLQLARNATYRHTVSLTFHAVQWEQFYYVERYAWAVTEVISKDISEQFSLGLKISYKR